MKQTITIIDIGCGNILSIQRAFEQFGTEVTVTSNYEEILSSHRLVLPGVGAFEKAMLSLEKINFINLIKDNKFKKIPLLGICLGMQLLFEESEEFGKFRGLGLIKGKVKKLPSLSLKNKKLKIPSIGWQKLTLRKKISSDKIKQFFKNFNTDDSFYFVHSYFVNPDEKNLTLASYDFGGHQIPSIVAKDNIIGCQFHPEKSGNFGLNLIKNFISL